jgi:hypothetical protein
MMPDASAATSDVQELSVSDAAEWAFPPCGAEDCGVGREGAGAACLGGSGQGCALTGKIPIPRSEPARRYAHSQEWLCHRIRLVCRGDFEGRAGRCYGWWLRLHTYAASADIWSLVSCAPPKGGIMLRYRFGFDTPRTIVLLIPA